METQTFITFGIVTFIAAIIPGPDMIYMASQAVMRGFRAGVLATLGILSGLVVHILAASLGLTAVFLASSVAFEIMRWLGVAYLCYLAYKMLTAKAEQAANVPAPPPVKRVYLRGVLTNVLNPKAVMFFLALFPQFIDHTQGNMAMQSAILGAEFLVIEFLVFVSLCYLLAHTRNTMMKSLRAQKIRNRMFGGMLGGSALWLALSNR